jgi:hypothetical protein
LFCFREADSDKMIRILPVTLVLLAQALPSATAFTSIGSPRAFQKSTAKTTWKTHDIMTLLATPEEDDDAGDVVVTAKDIRDEANEALASVGWARPMDDGEMTSDDPFVRRIDAEIQKDFGVSLDELLNPAKVVNLERDLYNLRTELASLTGKVMEDDNTFPSTEECDGGGGGEQADAIRATITKKETSLTIERRAVFRGWLKNVFLGQAILSLGLSWIMATNPDALFGGNDWYYSLQL